MQVLLRMRRILWWQNIVRFPMSNVHVVATMLASVLHHPVSPQPPSEREAPPVSLRLLVPHGARVAPGQLACRRFDGFDRRLAVRGACVLLRVLLRGDAGNHPNDPHNPSNNPNNPNNNNPNNSNRP